MLHAATNSRRDAAAPSTAARLPAIDVLRGFAILWVILYHLWTDLRFPDVYAQQSDAFRVVWDDVTSGRVLDALAASGHAFLRVGYLGVPLFMILSGVSLTMSAMREPRRTSSLARAARTTGRRLRRLLVPYYAGFAITIAFAAALALVQWQRHGGDPYLDYLVDGDINVHWDQLIAGALIVPRMFRDEWQFAPEGSLWFVLVLVQYYLLFPLLLRAMRAAGSAAFVACTLAVTLASLATMHAIDGDLVSHRSWTEIAAPFRIVEFAAGMAIGAAIARGAAAVSRARIALTLLAGGTIFVAGCLIDLDSAAAPLQFPLVAGGLALVALAVAAAPARWFGSAPAAALAAIGVVSYTALIINEPLRSITHTLRAEGASDAWLAAWVVALMALTLALARPLARVLGLLPAAAPLLTVRDLTGESSEPAMTPEHVPARVDP